MTDTRWKQRFENFEKAYKRFSNVFEHGVAPLSDLERTGGIQHFEFTFELAWKLMKDYLEEEGVVLKFVAPKTVIKEGFAANLIPDGQIWIDMLETRNELSHTYDEETFNKSIDAIADIYAPVLEKFYRYFVGKAQA